MSSSVVPNPQTLQLLLLTPSTTKWQLSLSSQNINTTDRLKAIFSKKARVALRAAVEEEERTVRDTALAGEEGVLPPRPRELRSPRAPSWRKNSMSKLF